MRSHRACLFAFILLALAMRMVVPVGWMPSFAGGGASITLCSSAGVVEAWVDADGNIHKQSPAKKGAGDQPCAFAGLGSAADVAPSPPLVAAPLFTPQRPPSRDATLTAPGHGLAAPPPPATGPPVLI